MYRVSLVWICIKRSGGSSSKLIKISWDLALSNQSPLETRPFFSDTGSYLHASCNDLVSNEHWAITWTITYFEVPKNQKNKNCQNLLLIIYRCKLVGLMGSGEWILNSVCGLSFGIICYWYTYRQTSNVSRRLIDNKFVDPSDVVGASSVGAAPNKSSFPTWRLTSIYKAKATARRDEKHLSFGIWCALC